MSYRVRCALIGNGRIGALLRSILEEQPDLGLTISAICDVAGPVTPLGSIPCFRDPVESIAMAEAVLIATPPSSHFEIAKQALAAGLAVFVEKPPAPTTEQCRMLLARAAASKLPLFFAFHARYNRGVLLARRALQDQEIRTIDIRYRENVYRYHPPDAWVHREGVLRDSGINALSVARVLLSPVDTLRFTGGKADSRNYQGGITRMRMDGAFGSHGRFSVDLDWLFEGEEERTVAIGTDKGAYEVDLTSGRFREVGNAWLGEPVSDPMRDEYQHMLADFARHCIEGTSDATTDEMAVIEEFESK